MHDACIYDGGSGPGIVIVGTFSEPTIPNSTYFATVAQWKDGMVTRLGPPYQGPNQSSAIRACSTWDAGEGQRLYVGGRRLRTGAWPYIYYAMVHRLDDGAWTPIDGLPGDDFSSVVETLVVFHDGARERLVAGGPSWIGDDQPVTQLRVNSVASWAPDEGWRQLGGGAIVVRATTPSIPAGVHVLGVGLGEGGMQTLYAGGLTITHAGGLPSRNFAIWRSGGADPAVTTTPVVARPYSDVDVGVNVQGDVRSIQWLLNGEPMQENTQSCNQRVFATATNVLRLRNTVPATMLGALSIRVEGPCSTTTTPVTLTMAPCWGDTNLDLSVDFRDINELIGLVPGAGAYGLACGCPYCPPDVTFDGRVDFHDLNTVLTMFGSVCEPLE